MAARDYFAVFGFEVIRQLIDRHQVTGAKGAVSVWVRQITGIQDDPEIPAFRMLEFLRHRVE